MELRFSVVHVATGSYYLAFMLLKPNGHENTIKPICKRNISGLLTPRNMHNWLLALECATTDPAGERQKHLKVSRVCGACQFIAIPIFQCSWWGVVVGLRKHMHVYNLPTDGH